MLNKIEEGLKIGLALTRLTREQLDKMLVPLVKSGELSKAEATRLKKRLTKMAETEKKRVEGYISKQIDKELNKRGYIKKSVARKKAKKAAKKARKKARKKAAKRSKKAVRKTSRQTRKTLKRTTRRKSSKPRR